MKKLNKNQWIAVSLSLAFLTYLLFAAPLMELFSPSVDSFQTRAPQTGLVTEEIEVGEGPLAEPGDILTVHYVGTLSDGQVFDSSLERNLPFSFTLGAGQVIRGWDEGFSGMRVGGRRRLIIAPDYGYGEFGVGTVPPNSTLFFEIELLNAETPAPR